MSGGLDVAALAFVVAIVVKALGGVVLLGIIGVGGLALWKKWKGSQTPETEYAADAQPAEALNATQLWQTLFPVLLKTLTSLHDDPKAQAAGKALLEAIIDGLPKLALLKKLPIPLTGNIAADLAELLKANQSTLLADLEAKLQGFKAEIEKKIETKIADLISHK